MMLDRPRPVLTTERLVLRPFMVTDAPTVELLAGDPAVARTTQNIPHPYPEGGAVSWIEGHKADWENQSRLSLAVTTEEHGMIGACGLRLAPAYEHAELGYWIGVPWWRQGYATEASRAVLEYAFSELALNRVFARHFTDNPASGAVMRKLGLRPEGVMRAHVFRFEEFHDVAVYGILRAEWVK